MSTSGVVSRGAFGLVFGLIVGFSNGGILSSIENGVVTGVLWAIFGLVAGSLYALWARRAVSARRLKGIGPLLSADTSTMLALADGDMQTITDLPSSGAQSLIVRFYPAARGALLEV